MTGLPERTPIVLCADDYGLAPGVSRAICSLVEAGRLSATTCMVGGPFWEEHAGWLKPHAGEIDVGLHLTLTDQLATGPLPSLAPDGHLPGLAQLMCLTYGGGLDEAEVEAELTRQFDLFEAAWGAPPDFCDGHQHVHQLPVVGRVVLRLAAERLSDGGYVRNCVESLPRMVLRRECVHKALLIAALGRRFRRHLRRRGLPTNEGFSGIYNLAGGKPYSQVFPRFLLRPRAYMLIMCHPGFVDEELVARDSMTHLREAEFAFFYGDAFSAVLEERGVRLSRFLQAA